MVFGKDTSPIQRGMLGKKHTKETKLNIGNSIKGNISWNKGMKGFKTSGSFKKGHRIRLGMRHSKKTKDTMSRTRKGRTISEEWKRNMSLAHKGEKNHAWKGGISFEPYGIEFNKELKEQIRTRDNHICQECNYTQEQLKQKLTVHHIDFNKRNNNPKNLISLCSSCHGQTQFNRKDWINYFQNKMGSY